MKTHKTKIILFSAFLTIVCSGIAQAQTSMLECNSYTDLGTNGFIINKADTRMVFEKDGTITSQYGTTRSRGFGEDNKINWVSGSKWDMTKGDSRYNDSFWDFRWNISNNQYGEFYSSETLLCKPWRLCTGTECDAMITKPVKKN